MLHDEPKVPGANQVPEWSLLIAIGIGAFLIRVTPILRSGLSWATDNDSAHYLDLAAGLRAGCGFAAFVNGRCEDAELLRTPGYPIFLAALPNVRAALFLQCALSAVACVFIGYVVARLWSRRAGAIAAIILALDVPTIVECGRIMSDVLFQFIVVLTIGLQLLAIAGDRDDKSTARLLIAASVLIAVAITIRPLLLVVPVVAPLAALLVWRFSVRRRIVLALASLAAPALVVVAWTVRNYLATGLSTYCFNMAVDLYYFKAAGVLFYRGHQSLRAIQIDMERALGLAPIYYASTPPSLQREMTHRALAIMLSDPIATVVMSLRCIAWLAIVPDRGNLALYLRFSQGGAATFYAASAGFWSRMLELLRSPALTALVAFQVLVSVVTWFGAVVSLRYLRSASAVQRSLVMITLLTAVLFLAAAAGPEAMARYRIPAVPLIAIMAGVGLDSVFRQS